MLLQRGRDCVEVVGVGAGVGVREVEMGHGRDGHDVDVDVGHLEAGDHQAHPVRGQPGSLLGRR